MNGIQTVRSIFDSEVRKAHTYQAVPFWFLLVESYFISSCGLHHEPQ
jgi:hypothetical protein